MKAIVEKWDGPFDRPITYDRTTGRMTAEDWMIRVYKLTKSGGISKNGGGYLRLEYCPICGERLIAAKEGEDEQEPG